MSDEAPPTEDFSSWKQDQAGKTLGEVAGKTRFQRVGGMCRRCLPRGKLA